jgi:hypothetical protein
MVTKKRTLLLNYVFYPAVGHAVEALKIATALYKSNKNLEVHVALNSATPTNLAEGCPWISRVYPINLDDIIKNDKNAKCLNIIPKEWDYLITARSFEISHLDRTIGKIQEGLVSYQKISDEIFRETKGKGTIIDPTCFPKGLRYNSTKLTFDIPRTASEFAKRYDYKGLKICILPAGSEESWKYPSKSCWLDIIKSINKEFPECGIYLTGVSKSENNRTYTQAIGKDDIDKITSSFPNIVDCYDIGLWNQIALLHSCDMLIAPHTGFAFLASSVNTPWLALSGGNWPEYLFNHFPFYSVLPDDKNYPYMGNVKIAKGRRIPHYTRKNIRKKIPEIIKAIHLLLDENFTSEKAMLVRNANIRRLGLDKSKIDLSPSDLLKI